ncbi:hypothetical protein [Caballeronia sordidicola]|nr:hypothetical protein [Caballeronia sordidicola]
MHLNYKPTKNMLKNLIVLACVMLSNVACADAVNRETKHSANAPGARTVHLGQSQAHVRRDQADAGPFDQSKAGLTNGVVLPETYGAVGDGNTYFDGSMQVGGTATIATSHAANDANPTAPPVSTGASNDMVVHVIANAQAYSVTPSLGVVRANQSSENGSLGIMALDETVARPALTTAVSGITPFASGWQTVSIALASIGTPSFIASTTYYSASTADVALPKPLGHRTGDYLLACTVIDHDGTRTITPPIGFKPIATGSNAADRLTCFTKVTGEYEPSTYTFILSGNGSSSAAGLMLDYRNVSGVDPTKFGETSSTLHSATAHFTSDDVGKKICVANIQAALPFNKQKCGKIINVETESSIAVDFATELTGGNLQFAYGTDDSAAFTTMLSSAPCSTKGCRIELGAKHYILTEELILPANIPISLVGVGPSAANTPNTLINGNVLVNANNGSQLHYLTQALTGPAVSITGSLHVTSTAAADRLSNFSIVGGVGTALDGGGQDGIDVLNWQNAVVDNVFVFNFVRYGGYVDALSAKDYRDYSENVLFKHFYAAYNGGGGLKVGSARAVYNIENTQCVYCIIEGNGGPGVILAGDNIQGLRLSDSTVQWNNVMAPGAEVFTTGTVVGGVVSSNYFEADGNIGSQSNKIFNNVAGMLGLHVTGDNYYTPQSAFSPLTFSANGVALPACNLNSSITAHATATVSDAESCSLGTNYVGGGSTICNVTCASGNVWVATGTARY